MRTRLLLLALALCSAPAVAQSPAPAPAATAPAAAAKAPATVLEDRLEVTVDASGKAREKRTWKIRIDDPARCSAGLVAPDGLDGAGDAGAKVFERLLVLPEGVAGGATFALTATRSLSGAPSSGVYTTAPDLPVEKAEVVIKSSSPHLTVWTDTNARSEYVRGEGRVATVSWERLDGRQPAQVVWTTWKDWLTAGDKLEAGLTPLLAVKKEQLGREIAADMSGISVQMATERVFSAVKYVEGGDERWSAAKKFDKVLDAREGTAVDRGVVLLSLLRLAGYDARPAMYRPASATGAVPLAVPAPAMLDRPVIAVLLPGRTVWVDPASTYTAVPELPASMAGATVWIPGDLPFEMPSAGIVDGVVNVSGMVTLQADGSATWSATISASGAGQEALRALLAPLDEARRKEKLRQLAGVGRNGIDRFGFEASGIEDPKRPLRITVQGYDSKAVGPFGETGVVGTVPPLLAPALAAWLPPSLLVREDLAVTSPSGTQPFSAVQPEPVFHPDAVLARSVRREGQRLVLTTEVDRPYRQTSAGRDAAAERFLHGAAPLGPEVLALPAPTPDVIKSLAKVEGRSKVELAVLEAMLWWKTEQPKKATKAMQKAVLAGDREEVAKWVGAHAAPGDARPWLALFDVGRTDDQRLDAVIGLQDTGLPYDAWRRAVSLTSSADPVVRFEALLLAEKLQGAKPDAAKDPEGAAAWREPSAWLVEAAKISGADQGRLLVRRAEIALAAGKPADAEVLLEQALANGADPIAMLLLAEASAGSGVSVSEVLGKVDEAVALAPFDAKVLARAARVAKVVGRRDVAFERSLAAARLAYDDADRWLETVGYALENGDLALALHAAKKASDLAPENPEAGAALALVGTLARDQESALLGVSRSKAGPVVQEWPPSLDVLMGVTPEHALLALLNWHDAEVIASPTALSLRAQLRVDAGQADGAARDGVLLATRHKNARGSAILFAATAGRLWSSATSEALDAAAKTDPVANATRMEYRLITGSGDPGADARTSSDDPRSQVVLRMASTPEAVADEVPGWPQDLKDPTARTPSGFKSSRILGAAKGVVAWSDPERAMAVIRTSRVTGTLPPPLALLYTPANPPLARLEGGGQIVRLDGGAIPLYAAIKIDGDQEVTAIGYTPQAATYALWLATKP
jgi:tetratricopeptide (TPR) repeat protein